MASKRGRHIQKQAKQVSHSPTIGQIHMKARLREVVLTLSQVSCIIALVALLTYNSNDPGWSHVSNSQDIHNAGGVVGAWFADFSLAWFGYLAYMFPLLVALLAFNLYREQKETPFSWRLFGFKLAGLVITLCAGAGIAHLHLPYIANYLSLYSGGILGEVIGQSSLAVLNPLGSTLFLSGLLLSGLTMLTGVSWLKVFDAVGRGVLFILFGALFSLRKVIKQGIESLKSLREKRNHVEEIDQEDTLSSFLMKPQSEENLTNLEEFPWVENMIQPSHIISARPEVETVARAFPKAAPKLMSNSELIAAEPMPAAVKFPTKSAKPKKANIFSKITCAIPSLNLLDPTPAQMHKGYTHAVLEAMSREVELRLNDFGVEAKVVAVHPGPVITRFEIQPAAGVKVSKISNLAKDLARSLSVISVRIVEVIPGKSSVGLEIPNADRAVVRLSEILNSNAYQQARSSISLALGKDISGHPVVVDLAKMPHLLVAGTTGSGKSVGVNAMILSLLFKATPDEVRMIMVDPKMLELSVYEGIPHLLCPVVTDMKEAANALRWCVAEMERRYRLMATLGVRNLAGYNQKVTAAIQAKEPLSNPFASQPMEPETLCALPYIVILIDEFADMMMVVGKKVEELIARLAQKARAAGIHMILATQRPSVDVITGLIKANIPTRISFQVSSKIDSRTILDQAGAEQLLGQGDMLYLAPGSGLPVRVHGAFVGDEEVHKVVNEWKQFGEPDYLEEILTASPIGSASSHDGILNDDDPESDPLYDQAVQIVLSTRRASISGIQRRLKIGYNRAARLVEAMEIAGLVGPMESNGNREVLIPASALNDD